MRQILKVLLLMAILPTVYSSDEEEEGLAEAEEDFRENLGLVLSDLSAEVAAKNRTFIAEKLAQIRNRKQKPTATSKAEAGGSSDDLKSGRVKKRLQRRKMKQKCLALTNNGSSKQIKKRVW